MSEKTVAIIGAGLSGLCALDASLEEGLIPTVFEANSTVGGVWSEDIKICYDSVTLNQCKYTFSFSKFPWPKDTQIYPDLKESIQYFEDFVAHNGYEKYIKFNHRVQKVELNENKSWTVDGTHFDFLMVATGVHNTPLLSESLQRNLKDFSGRILNQIEYCNPTQEDGMFKDKRVLVIGANLSGPEIAVELARKGGCARVAVLQRSPVWYFNKTAEQNDLPMEMICNRREFLKPVDAVELSIFCHPAPTGPINIEGAELDDIRMGIATGYTKAVAAGEVDVLRCGLTGSNGTTLTFNDAAYPPRDFDIIITACGMVTQLGFLPEAVQKGISYNKSAAIHHVELHEVTFPDPDVMPNAAFIGMHNSYASYFYLSEPSARWAAAVFNGRVAPDTPEAIRETIAEVRRQKALPYCGQFEIPALPQPMEVPMMERMMAKTGNIPTEILNDPSHPLYDMLKYGPLVNASYRLQGPHACKERAEEIIQEVIDYFKEKDLSVTEPLAKPEEHKFVQKVR